MKITKYGHSCLLVEETRAKLLIDPGDFSKGFEDLRELDAILITQQHPDHFVIGNLKALLAKNSRAVIYTDSASAGLLDVVGVKARAVHDGDKFEVAGVSVAVYGRDHAVIHPDIPVIPDVGYFVADRFFHPGDAYTVPDRPVEILAAPAAGPWLKVEEAIDYLRAVKPKVAIPIHDAVLSPEGLELHVSILSSFGQAGELRVLENGVPTEV